jgi:hypothetical protein
MRGRTIILVAMLGAAIWPNDVAHAQLSPQGILGGITRPLRQVIGHFGHFPRFHRHRAGITEPRMTTAALSNEGSTVPGSRPGWAGAPAWPSAYEDVLGFTFWPDDYTPRLHAHGFDVIADTVSGRFDLPRASARTATTGAAVPDASRSTDYCGDASSSQDNWPTTRLQQILQLSDAQRDTLEKLQAAVTQSTKSIRADCHEPGAFAPPDRLRALVQTLWVVRDAGISMRGPVKNFYETLTAAQKNSFASHQPQNNPPPDPKAADKGMNRQYQACAAQNAERAERLIKEIEMRVRPNKDQAESLENLHKISADMAKLLIASCAQPIPVDPVARLDAATDQLTALNYAATAVQIAFEDFYTRLDNEQKTRFDSLSR